MSKDNTQSCNNQQLSENNLNFSVCDKSLRIKIVEFLKKKTPQGFPCDYPFQEECEWCRCETFQLHAHHHPVAKCNGGKKVVNICPNCHYEYHYLLNLPSNAEGDVL